jgi:hypothetical protein
MTIRKRLRALSLSGFTLMVAAAASLAVLAPAASAAPRSAAARTAPAAVKDVTLCLTNSRSYCADVKNDSNVSGQTVWLYKSSQAKDYHWIEYSETCPLGTPGGMSCVGFADAAHSSLCMGMNASKNVVLMSCSAMEAAWALNSNNHLRNATWGPAGLLTVGSNSNGQKLFGAYAGTAWQKWSGE